LKIAFDFFDLDGSGKLEILKLINFIVDKEILIFQN